MFRFATRLAPLLLLVTALALPAPALERATARLGDLESHATWSRSSTTTLRYYNNCNGWVWLWQLTPGDRLGEVFETTDGGFLQLSWALPFSGAPCGYGYTGTISVHPVDGNDSPLYPALGSQPFCTATGWQGHLWAGTPVPSRFAVMITSPGYIGYLASDRPAAGPTGPVACGACYPTDRTTHSYYWGPVNAPRSPGDRFFDGFCDAELLMEVAVKVTVSTSVENRSWGKIKGLYR